MIDMSALGPWHRLDNPDKSAALDQARAAVTAYLEASASGASLPTNDACALPGGVEESRDHFSATGDGWMPIDTAPKDGTTVVLWSKYHDEPITAAWVRGHWVSRWDGMTVIETQGDTYTDYRDVSPATHWRPLPAPPAAQDHRP
jgi:hypothetical protein